MKILVVNVGTTSLKFRLFDMSDESLLAEGRIERVGEISSPFQYRRGEEPRLLKTLQCPHQRSAVEQAIAVLTAPETRVLGSLEELDAIGFKPVHAKNIAESVLVNDEIIAAMEAYIPLAPAHNPPYIEAFRIFQQLLPEKPLVGVFEPTFHKTIPDYARTYGIPYEWSQKHAIRRYGFHGASHRWVSHRAPELIDRPRDRLKIISCHLGGSSSMCAIRFGESIETSMGFSPQCGLPHATRSGDIDPFIPLYMMETEGLTTSEIREGLTRNGGLKGISGLSGDVRDLESAAAEGNARARLALQVLVHDVRKYVGAYAAVLEGLDVLAFTGGIGENGIGIREKVCSGLDFLGIQLDVSRNRIRGQEAIISTDQSRVKIVVVLANEELIIARETARLLESHGSGAS